MKSKKKKSTTSGCQRSLQCQRAAGHGPPCVVSASAAAEADRAAGHSTGVIVERILTAGPEGAVDLVEYRALAYELARRMGAAPSDRLTQAELDAFFNRSLFGERAAAPGAQPRPNQIMDREICALAEPCPYCGAAVGERCIDPPLHVSMPQIHGPRYVAAGLDPAGRQAADRCQTCPEPDDRCADCSGCPDHCVCDSEWDEEEPELVEAADSGARQCPMLSDDTRTRCVRRPQHTGKCRFEPKSRALRPSYAPEDRVLCAPGCALPHLHLAPCQDRYCPPSLDLPCATCGSQPGESCRREGSYDPDRYSNLWRGPGHLSFAGRQAAERAIHVAREAAMGALRAMFEASPELHSFEIRSEITYELGFKPLDSASPAASSREEQE